MLVPIIAFCAIIDGDVTQYCTTIEDTKNTYQVVKECEKRATEVKDSRLIQFQAIENIRRQIGPVWDNKMSFDLFCIDEKNVSDFLLKKYGILADDVAI
jgi:hypothetical protein